MERYELLKYEQQSVRLTYVNEVGPQTRSGFIYAISQEVVIFWPLNTEKELRILFKDIKDIESI